jgi:hypothetical protein
MTENNNEHFELKLLSYFNYILIFFCILSMLDFQFIITLLFKN